MSDKTPSEIRTFVNDATAPSLKNIEISFKQSNPQVDNKSSITTISPHMPEIKKGSEYEKSINEALQGVVIRAQILSEKKGNPGNIEKYKEIVRKAVNEYHIITSAELESGVKATNERDAVKEIQTNIIRADLLLEEAEKAIFEAEAALKNVEMVDLKSNAKVLEIEMELLGLLQLKLDKATKQKIIACIDRISDLKKLSKEKSFINEDENGLYSFLFGTVIFSQ